MVQNVVAFLELSKVRYTGCNHRGLTLVLDKALTKKILAYHRIPVPQFQVFSAAKENSAKNEAQVSAAGQIVD